MKGSLNLNTKGWRFRVWTLRYTWGWSFFERENWWWSVLKLYMWTKIQNSAYMKWIQFWECPLKRQSSVTKWYCKSSRGRVLRKQGDRGFLRKREKIRTSWCYIRSRGVRVEALHSKLKVWNHHCMILIFVFASLRYKFNIKSWQYEQ